MVFRKTHGSGPGRAVERAPRRPARACLAFLPVLALAACTIEQAAARAWLRDCGYTAIELSAEPSLGRACDWSEPFARRFVATNRNGLRVTGVICATGEGAQEARLLDLRVVSAPAWDSFSGRAR